MKKKAMLALGVGAILLIGATAAASMYVMDEQAKGQTSSNTNTSATQKERVIFEEPRAQVNTTRQQQVCEDGNIVGTIAGGAAGGLVGSQIGDGNGRTAATIGGAVGGALLGQKYMPTENVTCPGTQQPQEQTQQ